MFKKIAIAAFILGVTGVTHAAMYSPAPAPKCKPGDVTVPCAMSAWEVGADALIFQQSDGFASLFEGQDMDWKWGFRIEGGYHWGTGHDMNVNWAHYNNTTNNILTPAQEALLPGAMAFNPAGGTLAFGSQFDIINIEFGQHIDFGEAWDIRFHGGVQGAYLGQSLTGNAFVPIDNIVDAAGIRQRLSGWGPRAGADIAYNFDNGFAFFSDGAFSVLSSKERINSLNPGVTGGAVSTVFSRAVFGTAGVPGERNHMVTSTEYKLGARYIHPMAQGDLTWRVAWEGHNFINALAGQNDLAWDGVSFGLKWLGQA